MISQLLEPGQEWALHHGDCIPHLFDLPVESVDMSIFSPPFPSTFAYSDSAEDIGNSEDVNKEGKLHLSYFLNGMRRVMKPGRVILIHCAQIHNLRRSGKHGCEDFRGLLIRLGKRAGFIYDYDWLIRKNPQKQALRTKKWELKFQGLETDRANSRGAMCDYVIKFRAPGDNAVPITSEDDVSRNDWIQLAEGCWKHINEEDTLNYRHVKGENDTVHICPLQLGLILDYVKLFTNPGEIVLSPFAGIGSEGYMALGGVSPKTKVRLKTEPRRFYGIERKDEYVTEARLNLDKAIRIRQEVQKTLWDLGDMEPIGDLEREAV